MRISSCAVALCCLALSCGQRGQIETGQQATGGSVKVGEHLIYAYSCGSCHIIPGVAGANGTIGPTLQRFGSRYYIAGILVNTPENLIRWVAQPQELSPGNGMPDLGVTERQARDIAAYLYTLQ